MMLLEEIKQIKSDRAELRKFGLSVGIVLLLLGGVFWYFGKPWANFLMVPGAGLALLGLTVPQLLLPVQKVWMGLAVVLGFVMTRVILALVFFLMVTPIGLIGRILGKEFLKIKLDPGSSTYWNYREKTEYQKVFTERQF